MLFQPAKKKNVCFTINRSVSPVNSSESQHLSYSLQHPEILFSLPFSCHCLFCCIVSLAGLWGFAACTVRGGNIMRRAGAEGNPPPPRPGERELPPLPSARRPARPLRAPPRLRSAFPAPGLGPRGRSRRFRLFRGSVPPLWPQGSPGGPEATSAR